MAPLVPQASHHRPIHLMSVICTGKGCAWPSSNVTSSIGSHLSRRISAVGHATRVLKDAFTLGFFGLDYRLVSLPRFALQCQGLDGD